MERQQLIDSLFETMDIAKRVMHGRLHVITSDFALSRTQMELLFTIKQLQPIGSKQLAQKLQLTPGAVSQLSESLSNQMLIERETDTQDRRRHILRVSTQGLSLLKTIEKRRRTVLEHVMQDLSDEELTIWLRIQQKMISEFQAIHTTPTERSK